MDSIQALEADLYKLEKFIEDCKRQINNMKNRIMDAEYDVDDIKERIKQLKSAQEWFKLIYAYHISNYMIGFLLREQRNLWLDFIYLMKNPM